jgi:HAD superfamily hydrolase (TIGR01509 family)
MPFDLLIFDCDGVLVDSEPLVNRVFVEMLAELGFPLDYEHALHEFSGASMATRLETARRRGGPLPVDFGAAFDRRLNDLLGRQLRPVPGIVAALARLPGPRCVASNGSHHDMRLRLGAAGLLDAFEPYLFSAAEVARPKPYPDLFLHAAQRLGVPPSRCAVIEDSVAGVRAAAAAGMAAFGYSALTPGQALREAGARIFADMAQLPSVLEGATLSTARRPSWRAE